MRVDDYHGIPIIHIPCVRKSFAALANYFYYSPSEKMTLVGVTGTNGKSSVVYILTRMLMNIQVKSGMLGTIGCGLLPHLSSSTLTTGDVFLINSHLHAMLQQHVVAVSMEVSSHAIAQDRIAGLAYDYVVFTNITPDHIDYHKDFDSYLSVKLALFNRKNIKAAIINMSDVHGKYFYDVAVKNGTPCILYGYKNMEYMKSFGVPYVFAENIKLCLDGSSFQLVSSWGNIPIATSLLCIFSVENILAAIACLLGMGISLRDIPSLVGSVQHIPGRMQGFTRQDGMHVFVDYAHTKEALEKIITFINSVLRRNLIVVFGLGGNRDKARRRRIGTLVSRYADTIILTTDNPRDEPVDSINNDILAHITDTDKVKIIHDRAAAILYALDIAQSDDVVLIFGKGHETTQQIGNVTSYHSDLDIVEQNMMCKYE